MTVMYDNLYKFLYSIIDIIGTIKLCDFGSATTEVFTPNPSWSANQRNMLEENVSIVSDVTHINQSSIVS